MAKHTAPRHSMRLETREDLLLTCYNTMCAIAVSPACREFNIGYTHQTRRDRARVYYDRPDFGYQHMVLLSDRMNQDDALWLEEHLQALAKNNPDEYPELGKYRPQLKDDVYRRSSGGAKLPAEEKICSVYMAWLEPPENYDD